MNLAFDFGITNTDIVSSDDGTMDYFSFPSESVTDESLKKFLNSQKHVFPIISMKVFHPFITQYL